MKYVTRILSAAIIITICVTVVRAQDGQDPGRGPNRYVVSNLTSDLPGIAQNTDAVLQNAWGVTFTPGASPFWIADNATGCSTLYDGKGAIASTLQVKLPLPGGTVPATACMHADPKNPPDPAPPHPPALCGTLPRHFSCRTRPARLHSSGTPRMELLQLGRAV